MCCQSIREILLFFFNPLLTLLPPTLTAGKLPPRLRARPPIRLQEKKSLVRTALTKKGISSLFAPCGSGIGTGTGTAAQTVSVLPSVLPDQSCPRRREESRKRARKLDGPALEVAAESLTRRRGRESNNEQWSVGSGRIQLHSACCALSLDTRSPFPRPHLFYQSPLLSAFLSLLELCWALPLHSRFLHPLLPATAWASSRHCDSPLAVCSPKSSLPSSRLPLLSPGRTHAACRQSIQDGEKKRL